jgi:oligopeptide/dipeptide ABC transporter ATP-binding protein
MSTSGPLLDVVGLTKRFSGRSSVVGRLRGRPQASLVALDEVSLSVGRGETLGVVGESGSGKSTLARCLVRLHTADTGSVTFDEIDVMAAQGPALRDLRRSMQMIYQDPYSSLNPRMRVGDAVSEAALVHGLVQRGDEGRYAAELLERVGIRRESARRFPHEFSGGQRQRIAIARALAVEPRLLIADEAVSALDVSIQAQLLALFEEVREDLGLTIIFISHQLSVISRLADRVAIMYLGRIVETGTVAKVFAEPAHPYTRALLEAHPRLGGKRLRKPPAVRAEAPSPYDVPAGCRFHTRCPGVQGLCSESEPRLEPVGDGHLAACHFPIQNSAEQTENP